MGKNRYAKQPDKNQPGIVEELRKIPGVTVETDHDDILVGRNGRTYWFEVKNPDKANKEGKVFESKIKPSQKRIRAEFTGHYQIVTTLDEILRAIGL